MKLQRLDYYEFEGTPQEWKILDFTLGDINLIVGKNATGKTRTLNVIRGLAKLFSEVDSLQWTEGKYYIEFEKDNLIIKYSLEYHESEVLSEKILVGDQIYLTRQSNGMGSIYAAELKKNIKFQTQPNRVAAFAKRDSIQHPFLEDLYLWGEGLRLYLFGTPLGQDHFVLRSATNTEDKTVTKLNLKETQRVVEIYLKGEKEFSKAFTDAIISDMGEIGYDLEEISVETPPGMSIVSNINISASPLVIHVKESTREGKTHQIAMSQGMFRALSVLLQINYSLFASVATCILIDDIGEGLDFNRSSSLIKLLMKKAKKSSVQLIMATNDRFIMNNVPLEYWIVLERRGGECISHNYRNSKMMFDEFEMTGLNNFDLFSSEYYLQKQIL